MIHGPPPEPNRPFPKIQMVHEGWGKTKELESLFVSEYVELRARFPFYKAYGSFSQHIQREMNGCKELSSENKESGMVELRWIVPRSEAQSKLRYFRLFECHCHTVEVGPQPGEIDLSGHMVRVV